MEEKLYLVRSTNQETGNDMTVYYLARNLAHLEAEISDIIQIQPLENFDNLTT
jgi:hypothetical protein